MYFVLKRKLYKVELRLLFNITLTLFTMCSANPPLKREHISNSESLCYHSNSLSLWNIYIMSNVFTMQQPSSNFLLIPCVTFPLPPVQQSSTKRPVGAQFTPCDSEKSHHVQTYLHPLHLCSLFMQRQGPKVWLASYAANIRPSEQFKCHLTPKHAILVKGTLKAHPLR